MAGFMSTKAPLILGTAAAAAIAAYAVFGLDSGDKVAETTLGDAGGVMAQAETASEASGTEEQQEAATPESFAEKGYLVGDYIIGDPNAPVTIYEYASLTCPHCASFHNEILPDLKAQYIDTGKANLVLREVFFYEEGLMATAVARCGGAEPYERFISVMFKRQEEWSRAGDTEAVLNEIRRVGRQGGLAPERIEACMSDQAYLTALLQHSTTNAKADEIEATPTFVIDGEKLRGVRSVEELGEVIDSKISG